MTPGDARIDFDHNSREIACGMPRLRDAPVTSPQRRRPWRVCHAMSWSPS
jgi:hypothetical protein